MSANEVLKYFTGKLENIDVVTRKGMVDDLIMQGYSFVPIELVEENCQTKMRLNEEGLSTYQLFFVCDKDDNLIELLDEFITINTTMANTIINSESLEEHISKLKDVINLLNKDENYNVNALIKDCMYNISDGFFSACVAPQMNKLGENIVNTDAENMALLIDCLVTSIDGEAIVQVLDTLDDVKLRDSYCEQIKRVVELKDKADELCISAIIDLYKSNNHNFAEAENVCETLLFCSDTPAMPTLIKTYISNCDAIGEYNQSELEQYVEKAEQFALQYVDDNSEVYEELTEEEYQMYFGDSSDIDNDIDINDPINELFYEALMEEVEEEEEEKEKSKKIEKEILPC